MHNLKVITMKTEVQMKRTLFGEEIMQKSKNEFFSATQLVRIGNKWRRDNGFSDFNMSLFLQGKGTKEFMEELDSKYGKCIEMGRGRNSQTWVHPLLFIDMALAISPKLKIEVYEWLFDSLLKYRNDSGDSYKRMASALWMRCGNKREFPDFISKVADHIKDTLGVKDWETATEKQLELRDKIHNSTVTLCNVLTDPSQAVRLAIKEHCF